MRVGWRFADRVNIDFQINALKDPKKKNNMDIREEVINRLLRIIEQFSRKLRIALYLPTLLEREKFKRFCKQHHVMEIRKFFELCEKIDLMNGQSGQDDLENESKQIVLYQDGQNKIETYMPVVLENLLRYEDELLSMAHDNEDDNSRTCQETLQCIDLLKQVVEWQMRMTPKQVRERKSELRNAEILISRTQEDIEKLESEFNDETQKHVETINKSREEIKNLNEIIEVTRRKHKKELGRETNRYESSLRGLRDEIAEEENNFHSRVKAYESMLDKLTLVNLEHEKQLRALSIEAEQKHIIARNTYDRDLFKLDELKDTLEKQLNVLNAHCEILRNEYEVQSVLYLNLKKERELAMMQAFAEQLDNFEKNRAARIIQRTWRAYHERVAAKQKKKRGRKAK